MNSIKSFISEWFGYSRRERRASMILVIIIVIVILVRYLVPERKIDIELNNWLPSSLSEKPLASQNGTSDSIRLFPIDPNTAAFDDLTSLGVPGKVAGTLIRYRKKGGRFRRPEDIMKVYGMDSILAKTLIPYIYIEQPNTKAAEESPAETIPVIKIPAVALQININRCDSAALDVLPGIGPVLSARIIKYRELLGGYVFVAQLKEVYGIPDSVYRVISEMVIIDTSAVRQIKINSAGFRELDRHPYIERYEVQAIIKYRELTGSIHGISPLISEKILTGEKARKLLPYLSFE